MNVDYNDIDNKPDVSDSSFTKSVESSSNIRWDNAYNIEELCTVCLTLMLNFKLLEIVAASMHIFSIFVPLMNLM